MRKLPPFIVKKRKGKDAGFFVNSATGRRIKETTVTKYKRQYKRFKREGFNDAQITMPMLAGNMYVTHGKDETGQKVPLDKEQMTKKTRKLVESKQRILKGRAVSGRERYYDPVLKKFYTKKQVKRVVRDYVRNGVKVTLYRMTTDRRKVQHVLSSQPLATFMTVEGISGNVTNKLGDILREAFLVSKKYRLSKGQLGYARAMFYFTDRDGIQENTFYLGIPSIRVNKSRGGDPVSGNADIGTRWGIDDLRSDIEQTIYYLMTKKKAYPRSKVLTLAEIAIVNWEFKSKLTAPTVAESRIGVERYMRY